MADMKDGMPGQFADTHGLNNSLTRFASTSAFADPHGLNNSLTSVGSTFTSAIDPSTSGAVVPPVSALGPNEKITKKGPSEPMGSAEIDSAEHSGTPIDGAPPCLPAPGVNGGDPKAIPYEGGEVEPEPPSAAENLLSYLLPPDQLEERLGDFEEGFHKRRHRRGIDHARRWYWLQVSMVAFHAIFDVACRAAKIWSGFGPA